MSGGNSETGFGFSGSKSIGVVYSHVKFIPLLFCGPVLSIVLIASSKFFWTTYFIICNLRNLSVHLSVSSISILSKFSIPLLSDYNGSNSLPKF